MALLRATSEPARAANGDTLTVGNTFSGSATTELDVVGAVTGFLVTNGGAGGIAISGSSTGFGGTGVSGSGTSAGVSGTSSTSGGAGLSGSASGLGGVGVNGISTGTAGTGVGGTATATSGVGVRGMGGPSGTGVEGSSTGGVGVSGSSSSGGQGLLGTNNSSANSAVFGINSGSAPGVHGQGTSGIGVLGTTTTAPNGQPAVLGMNGSAGPGVQGFSSGNGSIGISGGTDIGVGFWGTGNGSGTGVLGSSITGTGVWGQSQSFFAGVFSGPVLVQGSFTVTGPKSAAVRGADGGLKRLYSLESPESWFEDFGSSQLSSGSATVQLEPGFAGVVHGDNYHVFLTPRGESKGWLYVDKQSPSGFTVQEAGGGTSNIGFSYRIVAKRKDIPGARLEHVDEPPTLPDDFKTPPTAPKLADQADRGEKTH
jgi:hypothetical protein